MNGSLPFISIIIPTYNRPKALAACLLATADLDYPQDRFEVIVVHDEIGCTVAASTRNALNTKIQLQELNQSHAGPAAARNLGAAHAQGQYLAFTDDDCLVSPGWLRALSEHLSAAPQSAYAGHTTTYHERNRYSQATQMINDFVVSTTQSMKSPFVTSNNLAVPTAEFLKLGGFDTRFPCAAGEDREFCVRWNRAGYRLDQVPEAVIHHAQDLSLQGFWRQQFGYGRAAFLLRWIQKPEPTESRVGLERSSFYYDLLRYPLEHGFNRKNVHLATLLALSQVAVAAGFLRQAIDAPRLTQGLPGVTHK